MTARPPDARPLRLAAISDLHADRPPNREVVEALGDLLAERPPEVLVVAGDVAPRVERLRATLDRLSRSAPEAVRLFVAGNHDVRVRPSGDDPDPDDGSRRKLEEELPPAVRDGGFHPLGADGPRTVRGVGFAGTPGWYDYGFRAEQFADRSTAFFARKRFGAAVWTDRAFTRWGEPDPAVARRMEADLRRHLETLQEEGDGSIVVVSHVLPYRELVRYSTRGSDVWDYCCAFLGSPGLGRVIDEAGGERVRLVVCGHRHVPFDGRVRGRRVIVAPLGYPEREWTGEPRDVARERVRRVDVPLNPEPDTE